MLSRLGKESLGNSSTDIKAILDLGSALTMIKIKHGSNLVPLLEWVQLTVSFIIE